MHKTITAIMLVFLCLLGIDKGQQVLPDQKPQAVIVPEDICLTITVPQADCPLQFEKTMIVKYLDKREEELYQVRNRGSKPIRSYTYATLTSTDLGGMYSWPGRPTDNVMMPGETAPSPDKTKLIEFVLLTEELRDKLKLSGPMKDAVIFMILKVEFADGSEYDDTAKYNKIREHVRQLRLLEKADDPNFPVEQSLRSLKDYIEAIR